MGNHEILKGQTDGIILFVLSKANRHTDELKQIIDEKFSAVKIGTLYSIISRLKTQKLISEYRASSVDGSRRKYYQLTDNGKAVFDEKYKDLFVGIYLEEQEPASIPVNEEIIIENVNESSEITQELSTENTPLQEEIIVEDKANDYASYINPNANDETIEDIDFSAFEQQTDENIEVLEEKVENQPKNEETEPDFIPYLKPTVLPTNTETDVATTQNNAFDKDYDSVLNSEYNYKDILDKLYPKPKVNKVEIVDENEELIQEKDEIKESSADWNDVYELAEKDGIKIKISSDTNRYQGSKILINKLNLFTSLVTLGAVLLVYTLLTLFLGVRFSGTQFVTLLGVFGGITLVFLAIFLIAPHKKIKDLPRFINVIEIALILTISTIIICFAMSAIREINFKVMSEVFNNLILPSVTSLSIPLFFIAQYLLSKLEFFESF